MIPIKTILTCLLFALVIIKTSAQQEIKFVEDLKDDARVQINRIINDYDLDDWVFTDVVKIVHGEDARSYPVLQMNTDFLEDDEIQLSIFIHENAHIFIARDEKDEAENRVIRKLRSLFPNPPAPLQKNLYHHIMVAWIEYDALIELFNEQKAREIMERKIKYFTRDNLESPLFQNYAWYNHTAMNHPEKVGQLMMEFGFNIHPEKGIVIK
jgi:hypothetical protein